MASKLTIPPEFDQVPENERIAFVGALWDRIAQAPERVPIPDEHKRILDERLKAYRENPKSGEPWDQVRDRLLAKFRDS